jgi:hypothetical protein
MLGRGRRRCRGSGAAATRVGDGGDAARPGARRSEAGVDMWLGGGGDARLGGMASEAASSVAATGGVMEPSGRNNRRRGGLRVGWPPFLLNVE